MPKPMALCLEDLVAAEPSGRYLRCVALVGRQPGLRLRRDGGASWQADQDVACELWVSRDDRLILYRRSPEVEVCIARAGRSLAPPCDKPVVLLDGDTLEVGPRRYRLHVHGAAPQVAAPSLLPARIRAQAIRATAVLAMGAAVTGCDKDSIEVREHPPDMEEVKPDPSSTATAASTTTSAEPIEVRETPPAAVPAPPSTDEPKPKPRPPK